MIESNKTYRESICTALSDFNVSYLYPKNDGEINSQEDFSFAFDNQNDDLLTLRNASLKSDFMTIFSSLHFFNSSMHVNMRKDVKRRRKMLINNLIE
jgi:hypothetical protein